MHLSRVAVLSGCIASAVVPAICSARAEITPVALEAHVDFLADDLLEGRDNGTRGYDLAARYVMAQFLGMGLQPGNGSDWYQKVTLLKRGSNDDNPARFSLSGKAYEPADALAFIRQEAPVDWSGEIIFAGHGVAKPEIGIDELAGLDLNNKLVAIFPRPGQWNVQTEEIEAELGKRGAAGILELPPSDPMMRFEWGAIKLDGSPQELEERDTEKVPLAFKIWVHRREAALLFEGTGLSFDAAEQQDASGKPFDRGFTLKPQAAVTGSRRWQRVVSPNILGLLPGSDARLKSEIVVVMAHLDHVGRHGAAEGADDIYNGAMDNAAGVASLIEIARALSRAKAPRRTILFAAVTAEEDGMFGSAYLARHMPARLGKVVAVVNMDMPLITYQFSDVTAFGAEESTLATVAARAAAKVGATITPDPQPKLRLGERSDHMSFRRSKIPFLFFQTGFANGGQAAWEDYMANRYHKPGDDLTGAILWSAGARFAEMNLEAVREISNAPAAPVLIETRK